MPALTVPEPEQALFPFVQTRWPPSASMMPLTSSLPELVDVPVPEIYVVPCTVRSAFGLDVPIPTLPCESMKKAVEEPKVAVVVPTQKSGEFPPAVPAIANLA